MIIQAFNPPTDELEKTYLSSPISEDAVALPVKNNNKFAGNLRILIGEMGTEHAEIVTTSGTTGDDQVDLSTACRFPHPVDTPIYILRFDTVKFYRSTNGENGTYSLLTSVDLDVDNADLMTLYDDTTGAGSYYYKTSVYHSITTLESDKSDPVRGSGAGRRVVGRIIDEMFDEFGLENETTLTRSTVMEWMNEVNDDLRTRVGKKPYRFMHRREAFARTANANTLDFPTDDDGNMIMWKFDALWYNYEDTSTDPDTDEGYRVRIKSLDQFQNDHQDQTIDSTSVSDMVQEAALDDAVEKIRYWPASKTNGVAVFYLYYWRIIPDFDSEGDEILTPTPKIYKEYIRGRYYLKLAKRESSYLQTSDRHFANYNFEVGKLPRVNRLDAGSPRSFTNSNQQSFKGPRRY